MNLSQKTLAGLILALALAAAIITLAIIPQLSYQTAMLIFVAVATLLGAVGVIADLIGLFHRPDPPPLARQGGIDITDSNIQTHADEAHSHPVPDSPARPRNSLSIPTPPGDPTDRERFDVFLSYSHLDAEWVEDIAERLEDAEGFQVWLDKWMLVPGEPWQQAMARGLDQASCCAVCIGEQTPTGWFQQEIQRALNRQTKDPTFRVIPVLLPHAESVNVDDFLELRTWVDFRPGRDFDDAFYLLVCGVKGIVPERRPRPRSSTGAVAKTIDHQLQELRRLRQSKLIAGEVELEFQRELLARHLLGEQ